MNDKFEINNKSTYLYVNITMRFPQAIIILLLVFASCSKTEEEIVPGNIPPPDNTIDQQVYEDYVTRTYIRVLGREPSSTEMNDALTKLYRHALSKNDRLQFLDDLFTKQEYYGHTYDDFRIELLNNLDSTEIPNEIFLFDLLAHDSTYITIWAALNYEIARLLTLQNAPTLFANHTITIIDMHRSMADNYFYDQINMGSVNFVVSMFQHFLYRTPTQQEQDAGASMVDGNNSALFLQTGASKTDFLNIFFASIDYYEGQVIRTYQKFLFRQPTSVEMNEATIKYKNNNDYIQLQKDILSTDEYVFSN